MWTWVSGSNDANQPGVYGTKGEASPYNVPGSRSRSVSWIDTSGNLWLFGGIYGSTERLNDLWKFDGTNWTWVSGSNTANHYGVYGTKGVAASGNVPGCRYGSVSWIDYSGNLWLFGGCGLAASGGGYLNDLWKFDGTNWTWVSGSNLKDQYGVYGTKGVAAPGNVPGGRFCSVSWIDSSGKLWLFGGYGIATSYGATNELWKFDGTNWTWVSGSKFVNEISVYGTKGVAASGNVPGARDSSVSWADNIGNLWLFGGDCYDASSGNTNMMNDLWKFDGTNWIWVSGSNIVNQPGVYGTKCTADSGNVPGARYASISWTDNVGNFWLFGGYGYAASGNAGVLNDLWKFDGTYWTWFSGSDITWQPGVYGEKGIPASGNVPGARGGFVSWFDGNGNLWLFGGKSPPKMYLNDLWKFGISENAADLNGNGIIDFVDFSILASQWLQPPGNPSADIAPSPAGDGLVNILDLSEFSMHWLETI